MKEFYIDASSGIPVYKQIVVEIVKQIESGILKNSKRLPTVRELAIQIHVNPNTVARSYRELERKGFIETFIGRGTFVKGKQNTDKAEINTLIESLIKTARENGVSISEIIKKIEERGGDV